MANKIKADRAQLKNAQHFGTDRSLIEKLTKLFGTDVTVADIMTFTMSEFMKAGLTGNQTERVIRYLKWYGHSPKDYVYANKRTRQTNVDLICEPKVPCSIHQTTPEEEAYVESQFEKIMSDPWYQDTACHCNC